VIRGGAADSRAFGKCGEFWGRLPHTAQATERAGGHKGGLHPRRWALKHTRIAECLLFCPCRRRGRRYSENAASVPPRATTGSDAPTSSFSPLNKHLDSVAVQNYSFDVVNSVCNLVQKVSGNFMWRKLSFTVSNFENDLRGRGTCASCHAHNVAVCCCKTLTLRGVACLLCTGGLAYYQERLEVCECLEC